MKPDWTKQCVKVGPCLKSGTVCVRAHKVHKQTKNTEKVADQFCL